MRCLRLFALLLGLGFLAACDWQGSSGSDQGWNSEDSWVNFSGTYSGSSGYLVSEYSLASSTAATGATDASVTNTTASDPSFQVSAYQTKVNGTLASVSGDHPMVPGTLSIIMMGAQSQGTFVDDGGGVLAGTFNLVGIDQPTQTGQGTIDYNTGVWTLDLDSPGFLEAVDVTATYQYSTSYGATDSSGTSDSVSGTSGDYPIYTFTVQQTGDSITLIDNNGAIYQGKIGDVSFSSEQLASGGTSAGTSGGTTSSTATEGEVIAQFSAEGVSAAGYNVTIVGTLDGWYYADQRLRERSIRGTWIEDGGATGDVNGMSTEIGPAPAGSTTTDTGTTTTQ